MKHFIFIDGDYTISPEFKVKHKKDLATKLAISTALLIARRHSNRKGNASSTKSGSSGSRQTVDLRQRAVIKIKYSGSLKAHKAQLSYITREGVGKDCERPELFGETEIYRSNMAAKNFRVFISPESRNIDLAVLAKLTIKQMEAETGFSFIWVGAEHHNTDNPHAHLVINGKDKNGKDVHFEPSFIKERVRDISKNICTEMLGQRTVREILVEKHKELSANKFTRMDKIILENLDNHVLNMNKIYGDTSKYYQRLNYLVGKGFATCENNKYSFKEGWDETLGIMGRHNMYLEGMSHLKFNPKQTYTLYTGSEPLYGYASKIFKKDDTSFGYSAVVETLDGKSWFVPFDERPTFSGGGLVEIKPMGKGEYIQEKYKEMFLVKDEERKIILKAQTFIPKIVQIDLENHGFYWNKKEGVYSAYKGSRGKKFQGVECTGYEDNFEKRLSGNGSVLAQAIKNNRVKEKYTETNI